MKRISLAFLSILPALAFAATPQVSETTFSQITPLSREVTVRYRLTGAPAVITMDVLTNGTSIGSTNIRYLSGDVNCTVQPDAQNLKTIRWDVEKSWPDQRIRDNSVTVKVTAWSLDRPPLYMLVDLSGTNGISYHVSADDLPYGPVTNDIYRTDYMVLRLIDAAGVVWTMGSATYDNTDNDGNPAHNVMLTNNYYVGIYEVTQGQWKKITGSYPNTLYTDADRDLHPAENVCYIDMRGAGVYWPNMPASDSWLGKICDAVGKESGFFDLPSEAQWGYAARANHFGDRCNDGTWYAATNLLQLAVYSDNSNNHTAVVGSKRPNDWGLYDMAGNVWEWCLDWKWADKRLATNFYGEVCTQQNGKQQVVRGGCFYNSAGDMRLGRRGGANYDNRSQGSRGFRIVHVVR
ncbi:MAG: SUMF1/EgtB/PvdO family nonheme iron enzyme [Kiritimatiellae bacterium]|nr:SUMF1/EgtB/PvdO family nonheme iron enzyme [Kiritimatiellia bacterium]